MFDCLCVCLFVCLFSCIHSFFACVSLCSLDCVLDCLFDCQVDEPSGCYFGLLEGEAMHQTWQALCGCLFVGLLVCFLGWLLVLLIACLCVSLFVVGFMVGGCVCL